MEFLIVHSKTGSLAELNTAQILDYRRGAKTSKSFSACCQTSYGKTKKQVSMLAADIKNQYIHDYDLLEVTLKENNLENCPGQIYNMDETGISLDPRPPNIIAKRGQKRYDIVNLGRKSKSQ